MLRKLTLLVCLLLLSALPVKALGAASSQNGVTASLADCVQAGSKAMLSIVSGRAVPAGGFWRIDVTWNEKPEGRAPEVLEGVPETDIRFFVPGRYRCTVETGIVVKGSCAGVTYDKVSTHTFDIEVKE
jgi:hypothetical protein